jgi:crotonobetainyl-CoA:carnitine CoA-transferase CaiB-like acyl-CoA transferase
LAAREFWQTLPTPWADGRVKFPGGFALFDGQRLAVERSAPKVGEHNLEVYRDDVGLGPDEIIALRSAGVL